MQAKVCPNCGSDTIDKNNYCPECDVQYSITEKEATPKRMGRMDELEDRVKNIEQSIGESSPQLPLESDQPGAPAAPADPESDEPEPDPDQDDEDALP